MNAIRTKPGYPGMECQLVERLWLAGAPRIPAVLRRIPDLRDDYSAPGEVKLRVPFYSQTDPYSCGPVAASMVVETFHPRTKFAVFYRACQADPRCGTTARDLVRAMRAFGVGVGIRRDLDFEAIADAIESGFPVIAGVGDEIFEDGDHWVLLYGINRCRKRLFICNVGRPGHSREELTWKQWKRWWNPVGEGLICWGKSVRS